MAIKIAGKASTKQSTRKSASTPTRRGRPQGSTTKSKSAAPKASTNGTRTRRPVTDDERVINRFIKKLESAGERRADAKAEHDAAVEAIYEVTRDAMEAGVPTGIIAEYSGISRQWLYKMSEHGGRDGSPKKSPGRKPAVHQTTSKPGRKPSRTRSNTGAKAKTSGQRVRIRTR